MAEYGSSMRPDWVPVTIRVVVPAGIARADAFDVAEHQIGTLKIRIKFDRAYSPVAIRPPRAEVEKFRKSEQQLFVVRAWVDPQDIAQLKDQPWVHHVARDSRLEPFGRPEPTMFHRTAALEG